MIRRICPKPGRIRPIAAVLLIGCMTLVDAALANAAPAGVAERCAQAAVALRDSLDAEQTRLAVSIFDEDLRRKWYYVTGSRTRKNGLTLGEMTDAQRVLAHRLLRCALSDAGYQKVAAIIRLDDLTAEFIGDTIFKVEGPLEIGREWYWFALFGEPDDPAPWGWQVEGHHLGLNITVFNSEVSVTPAFMGVNPAEIQVGPLAGWRGARDMDDEPVAEPRRAGAGADLRCAGRVGEAPCTAAGRCVRGQEPRQARAARGPGGTVGRLPGAFREYARRGVRHHHQARHDRGGRVRRG